MIDSASGVGLLSGAFGLLLGGVVSYFSFEELKTGKKYFSWFRNATLLIALAFFTAPNILLLVSTLLIGSLLLRALPEKYLNQLNPLLFSLIILSGSATQNTFLFSALFLISGLLQGSLSSSSISKKKFCSFVLRVQKKNVVYWILPVIIILVKLFV